MVPELSSPTELNPARVRILTLGQFAVEVFGKPLRFGRKAQKKPLALLKVLVALGGENVHTEQLTDALWPDAGGDQAYCALTSALARLRKLIGQDALVLTAGRLTIARPACWIDTAALTECLDGAMQAIKVADAAAAWRDLELALALYGGPFLDGEFDPPEILAAREKLHSGFMRRLKQLGEFFARSATPDKALQIYLRGVEIDPLAEDLYQDLMRCYQRQGRLAEALATYKRCRNTFGALLHCDPAPETQAIHRDLLAVQGQRGSAELNFKVDCPASASREEASANIETPLEASPDAAPNPPASQHRAGRRQLTVMDCELVDAAELSTRLDPEEIQQVIRTFRESCLRSVTRYDGFVAQYLGERIVAYFGYPQAHEDDAERAVRAGLDIVRAIARVETPARKPLLARLGVATGQIVAGSPIGAGSTQNPDVSGATPHLAAGLQRLAAPGTVVLGDTTRRLLGDTFTLQSLGRREIAGFPAPVEAWVAGGLRPAETRFEAMHRSVPGGFVGRHEELGLLLDRCRTAWSGQGQVVLLSGEAGIGKSRLGSVLRERVAREPHIRLQYQCSPYHCDSPLYPFVAQIERAAGFKPDHTPEQRLHRLEAVLEPILSQVAPALIAALVGVPTDTRYSPLGLNPEQQRRQTQDALLDQMTGLAQRMPLLILFEDAHWADTSSREFLSLAVARIRHLPILAVITTRPEFEASWSALPHVSTVELGRLDRRHCGAIVEHTAAGWRLPADAVAQIVAKADGIPLFVEELTKTVLASGQTTGNAAGSPNDGPPPLAVPTTLADSLMARLDRMVPAKEIAQIGSVLGREFSYALIGAVAGRGEAPLTAALAQLQLAGLVSRRGALPDAVYIFKHALVRDVAYESLLKTDRQALHSAVAEALRTRFTERAEAEPEVVAQHFTLAGQPEPAFEWWGKAGERALHRSANAEAIAHFGRGLVLAEGLPDSPALRLRRVRMQIAQGHALITARSFGAPETTAAFMRAQELAGGIAEPAERASVYHGLWVGCYVRGELAPMSQIADAFLRDTSTSPGTPESGWAHRVYAMTRWFQGDYPGAVPHFDEALAAYDPERDRPLAWRNGQDAGGSDRAYMALALWPMGRSDRARELHDELIVLAERSGHLNTIVYAHGMMSLFGAMRGDVGATRAHVEAALPIARDHGMAMWVAAETVLDGWTRWAKGDREPGVLAMHAGISRLRDLGITVFMPLLQKLVAEAEAEEGRVECALAILAEALAETERSGQRWFDAELHRVRGELLFRKDPTDSAGAEQAGLRSLEIARAQHTKTFGLRTGISLARLYRGTGRVAAERDVLVPSMAGFGMGCPLPEMKVAAQLLATLDATP